MLLTRLVAVLFIVQSPYSFTIGHRGVFSLGRWSGLLHAGFHEPRATLVRLSTPDFALGLRGFHPLWPAFPDRSTELFSARGARNPGTNPGLGCSVFARRYWRNRCLFLFLRVLRCFRSPRSLSPPYAFGRESPKRWGFPIRKSPDRLLFARSPELIAGCRVLRRLSMPRHPPYTLKSLTTVTDHRHRQGVAVTRASQSPDRYRIIVRRKRCSTTRSPTRLTFENRADRKTLVHAARGNGPRLLGRRRGGLHN